jgi:ribosome-associated protein
MTRRELQNKGVDPVRFVLDCARIADENKAEDVVVLDLRDRSSICDYFVICTGTSDRQMRTIADYIDEYAAKTGNERFNLSGYEQAHWILLDYVDVIIHLFDGDSRKYYDLELLWGDAPRLEWKAGK